MKPIHATLLFMALLLVLINSPLRAQEKPADKPAEPPAKAETPPPGTPPLPTPKREPEIRGNTPMNRLNEMRPFGPHTPLQSRAPEQKAVPFIGVLTSSVSPELRAQFNLQEGFGLQVVEVMPDTPAKTAGLKEHDILVSLDDQKLVNMEQLQTLVRSKKKDDQVNLTVISGGQRSQVVIKIGERMMPVDQEEGRGRGGRFFQMPPRSYGYDRQDNYRGGSGRETESMERFQERTRDYQKRLGDWYRNRSGEMPTPPMMDGPRHREPDRRTDDDPRSSADRDSPGARTGERRHESQQQSSISRRDESGEYQLRRDNDRTVFTVKPKDGAEQSWNVNEEAQRNAVPEQFRSKLKMLEDIRQNMPQDSNPEKRGNDRGLRDGERRPPPDERAKEGAPPPPESAPAPRKSGTI